MKIDPVSVWAGFNSRLGETGTDKHEMSDSCIFIADNVRLVCLHQWLGITQEGSVPEVCPRFE